MKGTTRCWRESASSFLGNLKPHATWILLRLLLSLWILWLNVKTVWTNLFFLQISALIPCPKHMRRVHWPYIDGVGAYLHNEADVEAALKAAGYQARNATRCHQSIIVSCRSFLLSLQEGHTQGHDRHQFLLLALIWGRQFPNMHLRFYSRIVESVELSLAAS